MKIRFLIAAGLVAAAAGPGVWGAMAPATRELPNFDKRPDHAATAAVSEARQQAVARLQAGLSDATVEWDRVLGMPKWISAPGGFLTLSQGSGSALSPAALAAIPAGDSNRVIRAFLNDHSDLFGHDASVLDSARVKRDYVTAHNGLRTVIWEQTFKGIPVFEGLIAGHITKRGELVNLSSRVVPDVAAAADAGSPGWLSLINSPTVSAPDAIVKAAADLGATLQTADLTSVETADGPEQAGSFRSGLLRGEARTKLVWLPVSRTALRLCWRVELKARNHAELYSLVVDAETGEVLVRRCLTNYATDVTYNVYTSDSPTPFSPGWPNPNPAQPPLVQRKLVKLTSLSTNASPAGWISDTGTNTVGNNVDAHLDRNDNDQPDLPRPSSTNRVFDFPLDLTKAPSTYGDAAVVQLFYLNNFMHDKLYDLGFTEAAGNFQTDNFGRGGRTNDAVQADAQDGSGTDNANFSTPPDGEPGRMQMYVFSGPVPNRDGDLDAEIVLHEYTHGLSNRLVGGGVGISELQPGGMGEGWSDFYGLSLLSEASDDVHAAYAMGGYATYQFFGLQDNYYSGIRRYPYSTDMTKNPLTFKDIDPTQADPHAGIPISPVIGGSPADEVHAMGEVWCVTLWEARANIIDQLGFDDGNRTMLQLVTDGMKLSPANPTFLQARDAILQADLVNSGGDNRAALWIAFAKRGMGVNAVAPTADTATGVTEDFTLPDDVVVTPPDGILEVSVTPANGAVVLATTTEKFFVRVTDGTPVTNATIVATINGVPGPTFQNDGVAPDKTANNAVYSASWLVPTNVTSATLRLVISAPGKDASTNSATYVVAPVPPNDNFANSIKVPPTGEFYLSNNRLATIETNEPVHAGLTNQAGSLWWTWSSSVATNVLVDSAGSAVDTLIGVYTGTNFSKFTRVASANNVGGRLQAYLNFNAAAGTSYRIAVASINTNSLGSIQLLIAPGRAADTNAPVLTVTSPPSGFTVTTNRVLITGSAVDPQPNPSGIDHVAIRVSRSVGTEEIIVGADSPPSLVESTNWSQTVALLEGLNVVRVTAVDGAGNSSSPVVLQVRYLPRDPVNDLFANAIVVTDNDGLSTVNTIHATKEFGEPVHANNAGGRSAWWSFRPAVDGILTLTTTNSTFDTLLAVYQGTRVGGLTPVASNDDAFAGSKFSKVAFAVRAGQDYRVAVDGFDAEAGVVYLGYSLAPSAVYNLTVNATAGGIANPGSGLIAANSSVVVTAVPQKHYDFAGWSGSSTATTNPLSIVATGDLNVTANFVPHPYSDGFESGGLVSLPWSTSGPGNVPWVVQGAVVSAGQYAARSGVITNGQTSSLSLTVTSPGGTASFDVRVSSEAVWDNLNFLMNGVSLKKWSGEVAWTTFEFPIPAGTVTLEWRYEKDVATSTGLDAAFLDNLDLPLVPTSLQLANPTATGFQIQVVGQPSETVLVQFSTDLATWHTESTNVVTGSGLQYVYPNPATNQARFYRVVAP